MNARPFGKPRHSLILLLAVLLLLAVGVPVAHAAVWTDQLDYAPGSVVTISGDNVGLVEPWAIGAEVTVQVTGPLGYEYGPLWASVGLDGSWSCQFTLSDDAAIAVGEYAYSASAAGSFETQSGTFTDANPVTFAVRSNILSVPFKFSTLKQNNTLGSVTNASKTTPFDFAIPGDDKKFVLSDIPGSFNGYTYAGWTYVTDIAGGGSSSGTGTRVPSSGSINFLNGNSTVTLNYADRTAPAITVPDDITAEATSADGAVVTFEVSATDAVDPAPSVSADPASGSTFALGETTVTVTASDAAGNTAMKTFLVTVKDTIAPAITVPDDITAEATSADGAVVTFEVSATDAVDPAPSVSADPASGSTFALGETTVTVTASDAAGNTAMKTFLVTVKDTIAPAITVPDDITAEATSADGAVVTFEVSATDAVDPAPSVSADPASGSTFALGETTVTVTASDAAGNTAMKTFLVTVKDTIAPAITVPDDITAEATSADGAVVTFEVSATDAVDPAPSVSADPASGSTFALGETTVTVTASDAAGNTAMKTFLVTVKDTIAPAITVPDDITAEATSADGAVVTFEVSATDAVDPAPSVSADPASGSTFALGETTVTVTASDAAGNTAMKTFLVTVKDTIAPAITVPDDITAEATSADGAVVTFEVSATDAVDPAPSVSADPASGSTFALGETTVTVTASDAAGNASSSSFTVTVVDTTPPAGEVTINHGAAFTNDTSVSVLLSATDAVGVVAYRLADGLDASLGTEAPASGTPSYTELVTYVLPAGDGEKTVAAQYCDAVPNWSLNALDGIVLDQTRPEITQGSATGTVGANGWYTSDVIVPFSAADNLSGFAPNGELTTDLPNQTITEEGTARTVKSGTISDRAGNEALEVTSVPVNIDKTKPTLTLSKVPDSDWAKDSVQVTAVADDASPGSGIDSVAWSYKKDDGAAIDGGIGSSITFSDQGVYAVSCAATDKAGNTTTADITVSIDLTAPTSNATHAPAANAAGWNNESVTVTLKGTDTGGSGIDTMCYTINAGADKTCPNNDTLSFTDEGKYNVEYWAKDIAGNVEATHHHELVWIDKTAPVVAVDSPGSYLANQTAYWSVTDPQNGAALNSGVDTSSVVATNDGSPMAMGAKLNTATIGKHTLTVTANDKAGNSCSTTLTYWVGFNWLNFQQPINVAPASMSAFKCGSTIPVKFRLSDVNDAPVMGVTATIKVTRVAANLPSDYVAETIYSSDATIGDTFRYDSAAGQYIFNLGTLGKKSSSLLAGNVYRVWVTFPALDGMPGGNTYFVDIGMK